MKKNIVLIGFMGTGKTTVSKKLSEMLDIKEIFYYVYQSNYTFDYIHI